MRLEEYTTPITPELVSAIREVYFWQHNYSNCFSNKLFDLISHADDNNKMRIAKGFKEYVQAYYIWFYKAFNNIQFTSDEDMLRYFKENS